MKPKSEYSPREIFETIVPGCERRRYSQDIPEGIYLHNIPINEISNTGGYILYLFGDNPIYFRKDKGFRCWTVGSSIVSASYQVAFIDPRFKTRYLKVASREPGPDMTDCIDLI